MGNLLEWGAKKLVFTALGVVAMLGWWTIGGDGAGGEELDRMPAVVFEGGAGTLSVEIETGQPAELHASFEQWSEEDEDGASVFSQEELAAGHHVRSVDVSPDTYVYIEVGVPGATVGATLSWTVYVDGEEIYRESDRLEQPLGDGYAFFIQLEADSVEQIRSWAE